MPRCGPYTQKRRPALGVGRSTCEVGDGVEQLFSQSPVVCVEGPRLEPVPEAVDQRLHRRNAGGDLKLHSQSFRGVPLYHAQCARSRG